MTTNTTPEAQAEDESPEVIEAKLRHANLLRMWHLRQGPYANPNVPPPRLDDSRKWVEDSRKRPSAPPKKPEDGAP